MAEPILTKFCPKCQETKSVCEFNKDNKSKSGYRVYCKSCLKEYSDNNKTKKAIYMKEYRISHKKEISITQKAYRKKHDQKEYNKEYWAKNKVHLLKIAKIKQKEYYKTEAGMISAQKCRHKYRALKKNAIVEDFNPIEVFERDGYRCQICNKKTRPDFKNPNHPLYPNLDHLIPLSKGGSHTKINCQCLCHKCNLEKNNKTDFGDQIRMFG